MSQLELWDNYRKAAIDLECDDIAYGETVKRIDERDKIRLLHSGMGISGEAGELLDALKKHFFYGKALDRAHVIEELGDIMWYINLMLDELDIPMGEVLQKNIHKLRNRYGGQKFGSYAEMKVDREKEKEIMETNNETDLGSGC